MNLDMRLGYCTRHGSTTECLRCTIEDLTEALSAMEADRDMYRQKQETASRNARYYGDMAYRLENEVAELKNLLAFEKDQRIADGQGREVGKLLLRKDVAQEICVIIENDEWITPIDLIRTIRGTFGLEI